MDIIEQEPVNFQFTENDFPQTSATLRRVDLVRALVLTGVKQGAAASRIENLLLRSIVRGIVCDGRPWFSWEDAAVALALSALVDGGISDPDLMEIAAVALRRWSKSSQPTMWQPIAAAVRDHAAGEPWCLRLDIGRDMATGESLHNASFTPIGAAPAWIDSAAFTQPHHLVAMTIIVNTHGPLSALMRLIGEKRGN